MKLQWEKWEHPLFDLMGDRIRLRAEHRDQRFAVTERVDGRWVALTGHTMPERVQDFDSCEAAIAACEEMVHADS